MATVNLGRIKPIFKGAYAGGTAYVVDDIVTSGNETFICIQASTGNATSNASYWTKLAAKGTDGTDVGATLTTQGDILYRDGSGLQRLPKGTANQVLKMNAGATAPEYGNLSSDFVKITSGSISNQGDLIINNLDFTTYKNFKVYLSKLNTNNSHEFLACRLQYDNSGSPATETGSVYTYALRGYRVYGNVNETGEDSSTSLADRLRPTWSVTSTSNGGEWKHDVIMEFGAWNNTDSSKHMKIFTYGIYDNGTEYNYYLSGMGLSRNYTRAYNGVRFFLNNSNNFNCDYQVYGIK